ncbi:hypothetical protein NQD34_009161, partial [Periophthalmus magnuspinnatus]
VISMCEQNYCELFCIFAKCFLDQIQSFFLLRCESSDLQHQQKDVWSWSQETDAFEHFLIDLMMRHGAVEQAGSVHHLHTTTL